MPEDTAVQIVVNHISADELPDWIEIPGSTKRAGFKSRANFDKPRETLQRARRGMELARQITKEYFESGKAEPGKPLPTVTEGMKDD